MYFCNIDFNILKKTDLFSRKADETKIIIPMNAQVITLANKNERLLRFINNNYSTFDGQIPINRFEKNNKVKVDKISGSDIVYDFCQFARENDLKVFFLGGQIDSNEAAVKKIRSDYEIRIDGFSPDFEPYPFSQKFIDQCKEKLDLFNPDILFVGYGAPKQEFFIEDNLEYLKSKKIKYIVCCGGTFEFVSGKIKRAPKWIQKTGLESIYRLFREFNKARINRILYSFKFFKYIKNKPDFEK